MLMTNFHFWLTFWYFCGEFQAYWKNVVLGNRLASRLSGFSLCESNIVKKNTFCFLHENWWFEKNKKCYKPKGNIFSSISVKFEPKWISRSGDITKTRSFFYKKNKKSVQSLFLKLGCVGVSSSFPKIDYNFNQLVLRAQEIFFGSEKSFEKLRG